MASVVRFSPGLPLMFGNNVNFITFTVDSTTDGVAYFFDAPAADTITALGVRVGTITGTAPTYKIGFMGRTASTGMPDGAYLGGGSEESATFTPTTNNTWEWVTLDNSRDVTQGEAICVAITYSSGTIDGSNNVSFTTAMTHQGGFYRYPTCATEASGTWSLQDDPPNWGMRSSTRDYGPMVESSEFREWRNSDNPDEYGIAFTPPDGITDTINVGGLLVYSHAINSPGASDVLTVQLAQDTTVLQDRTHTGQIGGLAREVVSEYGFDDTTLSDLSPGTEYILSLRTDSTTDDISMVVLGFASSTEAQYSDWALGGAWSCRQMTRNNQTGAWTADGTKVPLIRPIFVDLTEPAGGGGGGMITHPGMSGGMRG